MGNKLRDKICDCPCNQCRALIWLINVCGAKLNISAKSAGRLCELAVVAACGSAGMQSDSIVTARRQYAKHLNIELKGPTSDADDPTHIKWALKNSNHNPDAKNKINLCNAYAIYGDGRYFICAFYS